MENDKEEAIQLISRLPDDATWQEILYRLHVRGKLEEGIESANDGRVISHDEVKQLFARPK